MQFVFDTHRENKSHDEEDDNKKGNHDHLDMKIQD
jgi:hypothetical protein